MIKKGFYFASLVFAFFFLAGCNFFNPEITEITITFDSQGGSPVDTIVVSEDSDLTLPTSEKEGYHFVGWFVGLSDQDGQINAISFIKEDVTLYAVWEIKTYLVVFLDYDDQVIHEAQVDHGGIVTPPSDPVREGYEFTGWNQTNLTITSNQTIQATYRIIETASTYVLSLDAGGSAAIENIIVDNGQSVVLPTPDREGYIFKGWKYQNEMLGLMVVVQRDMHLKAIWEIDISSTLVEITLRVPSGTVSSAIQSFVEAFKLLYPNITVNVNSVSGGYGDVRRLTILDIQENRAPTMVVGYPDHFAEYYSGRALVNLEYLIDGESGFTQAELDDFVQSYLNEGRGFDDENPTDLFTFPFNKSTEVLVYNKTMMDALMAKAPGEVFIPKTWEELSTVAAKIIQMVAAGDADDVIELAAGELKPSELLASGQFVPFVYNSATNAFLTMTQQLGGAYTEKVTNDKGLITFHDNLKVFQGLTYFQNEAVAGRYGIAETFDTSYAYEAFKTLKTFMMVGSSAGVTYNVPDDGKFEIDMSQVPYLGAQPDNKFVIQQGANIGILNQSSEIEQNAAWLFLKFLMEPANTAALAMATGGHVPIRESAYLTAEYEEYLENPPINRILHSAAANVALSYLNEGYQFFGDPVFVGSRLVRDEVAKVFSSIIVHKRPIQDCLDAAYLMLGSAYHDDGLMNTEDEISNILLPSEIVNLTGNLYLPKYVYQGNNQYEIEWTSSESIYFLINKQINNSLGIVTRPPAGSPQETIQLVATITQGDESYSRSWTIYVKPMPSPEQLTIADVKTAASNTLIEVIGTVSYAASNRLIIQDATGGIFVFTNSPLGVDVKPGAVLKVVGTMVLFYNMPQIQQPTIEVITEAPSEGFDYSTALDVDIAEVIAVPVANLNQYGRMVRITGVVVKDVLNVAGTKVSDYGIKDLNSDATLVIYNSSTAVFKAQLEQQVGETVTLVVIAFDFHSSQLVWRFLGVEGTISLADVSEPS